jgi:hypothetical protein
MGQESLTRFDQPKKRKNQAKPRPVVKTIVANNKKNQQITTLQHRPKRKPAAARKPIIITKMRLKNSFFILLTVFLFIHAIKKEFLTSIKL